MATLIAIAITALIVTVVYTIILAGAQQEPHQYDLTDREAQAIREKYAPLWLDPPTINEETNSVPLNIQEHDTLNTEHIQTQNT